MSSRKRIIVPSSRLTAVREIQLIDRAKEMNVLRKAADRAASGQGGIVFLYGEAGIGKTRLARELGAYAHSRGMQVLSGRCPALFRMDGVPPYVLWEEVIKDYLEVCTPDQLFRVIGSYPIEVSKLVPELKQKLRTFPQSFPLSPEYSRDRLFEAVSQFITNISRETPLVVILDDLQWTDQSSLLLLHYMARGVYKEPLLLLGAYRDTYVDKKHPLSPVLAELNRERLLQSVQLKRLSFNDVLEMIRQLLEQDDVPKEFCELVFEKTRGNPFFVEEVIKSLKEEEVIYREEKKWKIQEVSRIEFPETVKDVIKARIDRLDDNCQRVLTMASFIGKDFTFEALRGVLGLEEDKLRKIVDRLLKTGLLKYRAIHGEDTCSFTDVIVRDVVHEEVGPFERKQLHSVVGQSLEKVYAEKIDEHLGELALHFLEGGGKDKALDYFLKAGEKSAKVYANSEASSYFQSALTLLEEKKGELQERGRVLEELGDIEKLVGDYDTCMKHWNEALVLWEKLHEKVKISGVHRKLANILWDVVGDAEKARNHYNRALKILEAEPESVELASLYMDMAGALWRSGDMTKALSFGQKALELAEKLNDFKVIARSYLMLGLAFSSIGDEKKGVQCFERALKIALDNGYLETASILYNNLAASLTSDENQRIFDCYEKGYNLAKKIGDIRHQSWIGSNLSWMYIMMGNADKAISLAEESVALNRKAGNMINLCFSIGILGLTYQVLGEWEKTEQCLNEALTISQRLEDFQSIGGGYGFLGWFHFDKGEYVKARELFEKMYASLEKAGAREYQIRWSPRLIWTYIELGEIKKAEDLIDNLHDFALEVKDKGLVADTDALRGMLFRAQKKWKESVEHFKKSLKEHEALNARRWNIYLLARVGLSEYARVYLERDREGDREKALNLLNQALEIFQKIGAKKDVEKTKAKMIYAKTGREIVQPEPTEAVLPSHIATGHGDLDDLLFGGIPKNYAVILTSPSCDERDLLIKRFLTTGVKEGEIVFHIVAKASGIESLAEDFQSNFYLFMCNPEADAIIKSLPNVFKLKGVENLNDINIALNSAFGGLDKMPKRARRVCIEIVSDVLLQHHTVQTRRWLNALIPKLKSKGFTTLAVLDSEIHPQQEVRAIVGVFEGEINIREKETKEGLEKFLKIKKMYNRKYSKSELLLQEEKL